MIHLLILVFIKICDNIVSTAKTISVHKGRKLLSALLVTISQFLFYFVVNKVVSDNSMTTIIIVSIASGIGTYVAFVLNNKYEKDIMWTNILTCDDKDDINDLCFVLKKNRIKYIVNRSYTRDWQDTYSVLIFSMNKQESNIIDKYLSITKTKYLRQILK